MSFLLFQNSFSSYVSFVCSLNCYFILYFFLQLLKHASRKDPFLSCHHSFMYYKDTFRNVYDLHSWEEKTSLFVAFQHEMEKSLSLQISKKNISFSFSLVPSFFHH